MSQQQRSHVATFFFSRSLRSFLALGFTLQIALIRLGSLIFDSSRLADLFVLPIALKKSICTES